MAPARVPANAAAPTAMLASARRGRTYESVRAGSPRGPQPTVTRPQGVRVPAWPPGFPAGRAQQVRAFSPFRACSPIQIQGLKPTVHSRARSYCLSCTVCP
eukprot:5871898-Alexandrium_andersonii.AAC.1